jgi:hypothetical protein
MVFGADVDIDEILDLLGREVVGRFYGKIVSTTSLHKWMDANWSSLLGYQPEYHTLA